MKKNKIKKFNGIGTKPIDTTCNCGRHIRMWWNGNYHSADCLCGRNVRSKGSTMIIDFKQTQPANQQ